MLNYIKNFRADEDGAVTVDWVVLTAAVVGLGMAVLLTVQGGAEEMAGAVSTALGEYEVNIDGTPSTGG